MTSAEGGVTLSRMISPSPHTSIVMPVFQGMPYLPECVDSVLNQSQPSFELLVRDDGSTDGSREYLASLKDPRVRILQDRRRFGLFRNLNALLDHTKGKWIRILCQDDRLERCCLEEECSFLEAHPELRVLCVYLRGAHQKTYGNYPRRDERFFLDMAETNPQTSVRGLRAHRELSRQIILTLKEMENGYFEKNARRE